MEHLERRTILKYLADELGAAETVSFEAHLEACDICHEQFLSLIESGDEADGLPSLLEMPSDGFADRVMSAVLREDAESRAENAVAAEIEQTHANVVPLRPRRQRRFESFTHFVTAAVVTGFMVLGSYQVQGLPTFGVVQTALRTGDVVTDGTYRVYTEIHGFMARVNSEIFQ